MNVINIAIGIGQFAWSSVQYVDSVQLPVGHFKVLINLLFVAEYVIAQACDVYLVVNGNH